MGSNGDKNTSAFHYLWSPLFTSLTDLEIPFQHYLSSQTNNVFSLLDKSTQYKERLILSLYWKDKEIQITQINREFELSVNQILEKQ